MHVVDRFESVAVLLESDEAKASMCSAVAYTIRSASRLLDMTGDTYGSSDLAVSGHP